MRHLYKLIFNTVPDRYHHYVLRYRRFIVYSVIGGLAVMIDFSIFAALALFTAIPVLLANTISTFTAMVYSFLTNAFFNFKVSDKILLRFVSFSIVTLCGYLISTGMLWLFVTVYDFNPVLIKAASLPVVLLVQFYLNSKVTFKRRTRTKVVEEETTS
jgi:putative flippase GtrA